MRLPISPLRRGLRLPATSRSKAVLLTSIFLAASFSAECQTSQLSGTYITSVSAILPQQTQTITITGKGFGTQAPYSGESAFIAFTDLSANPVWAAGGYVSDYVGLVVSSWTDTQIVISGFVGEYGSTYHLNNGDIVNFYVANAQGPVQNYPELGSCSLTVGAGPQNACPLPSISAGGIVPVFSSATTIEPGSWISIYGANLTYNVPGITPATVLWNGNFPTYLGSIYSITINGKDGYLWFVSPSQINLQAPDDTTTGPVPVVVNTNNGTVTSTVTLGPYGPSFSMFNGKYPAAIAPNASGTGYDYLGPTGAFTFPTRPVKPGETILLFGVGFGATNPPVSAGEPISNAAPSVTLPTVTIGGVQAIVQFAGIIEAGLFQLNVTVPNVGSGDQPLVASIGGVQTPGNIYLTIQ
jgi:uncharacterized protein (TIGR03437 family)